MKWTPLMRREVRRGRGDRAEPGPGGGELNIVPFLDVVVNLMLFLLATSATALAMTQQDASLPGTCAHRPCAEPAGLELSVMLLPRGAAIGTRQGFVAEGCQGLAPGFAIAVPAHDGRQDSAALAQCLARIQAEHPTEQEVVLSADAGVPYSEVVVGMDACRASFPRLRLAAGVR